MHARDTVWTDAAHNEVEAARETPIQPCKASDHNLNVIQQTNTTLTNN